MLLNLVATTRYASMYARHLYIEHECASLSYYCAVLSLDMYRSVKTACYVNQIYYNNVNGRLKYNHALIIEIYKKF